jgi:ubiquinone/menaquinone biosynthesis C-methylase UbiE
MVTQTQTQAPAQAQQQSMLTFDAEVGRKLEAIYSTREAVARRRAALDSVQPKPGERGLDIGPGPGLLACELARQVGPAGRIATIDNNPTMLAMTHHRALELGVADQVELHEADAKSLPFPDGTFDFVVASQIYEYVSEIGQALAEACRVLRPGGRLAIIDTDWDTLIIQAGDATLTTRVNRAWDEHLAHRTLPRQLPGLLQEAGFRLASVNILPVLSATREPLTFDYGLIDLIANFARGRAGVTPADADTWLAGIEQQSARGSYFFSLNQYLFRAVKPDATAGI